MSDELKPYPFCGASVEACSKLDDGNRYYWLHCECGASAGGFRALSLEELARAWNRRATPPVVCGNCGGTGAGGADTNGKTEPCPYCRPRGGQ